MKYIITIQAEKKKAHMIQALEMWKRSPGVRQ